MPAGDRTDERLQAMVIALNRGDTSESAARRLNQFRVPGDVATRSRWRYLLDPLRSPISVDDLVAESAEGWQADVELESQAEATEIALGDSAPLWDELLARERQHHYRFITVNALLGRADYYRRSEAHSSATDAAREAQSLAESFGYRFGVMRAQLIRGYVDLVTPAGHDAARRFREAETIAATLDEPLYEANAWLGRGQVHLARGRPRPALAYARKAMRRFKRLGSTIGVSNAQILLTAAGEPAPDLSGLEHGAPDDVVGTIEGMIAAADQLVAEHQREQAAAMYTAAKDRAEGVYPRGEAHAWMGLGRMLETVGEDALAAEAFTEAAKLYDSIRDTTGQAYSQVALSGATSRRGRRSASVKHDENAIVAIESLLNEDPHSTSQTELSQRFSTVYVHAIRNAVSQNDPDALLLALENLAGRRLTGIASGSVGNLAEAWLTSGLAAIAAERRAGRHPDRPPPEDPETAFRRRIGRIAVAHGIPGIAGRDLESTVIGHHEPVTSAKLATTVHSLPVDAQVLVISPVPSVSSEIVWWLRMPNGTTTIGRLYLEHDAQELLTRLATRGITADMYPADLLPLGCLLPEAAKTEALKGTPLVLAALGQLGSVPWLALTVADQMLGELAPVVRCPTLGLYPEIASRADRDGAVSSSIALWRNPTVQWTRFTQLRHDPQWSVTDLQSAGRARHALQSPITDVVAIACHGRPSDGIGHYLDLGGSVYLTAADCMVGTPPTTVVLVSCWGAAAPTSTGRDPLSVANVLLARGSRNVLATTSQLADTPQAAQVIDDFLYDLATMAPASAYHSAVSRYLRMPANRRGRLWHWAPVSMVGAL